MKLFYRTDRYQEESGYPVSKKHTATGILFTVLMLSILFPVMAQKTIRIKGRLISELDREPVIGAVVWEKGTSNAVNTDAEGHFTLELKQKLPVSIAFTLMGFLTKEIEIFEEEEEMLEVTLRPRVSLGEVVITAVGVTSKKAALGYSVSKVGGKEIKESREINLVSALAGKVAGVQVSNTAGSPGAAARIRIRGSNSILGNNDPLYVVDGVPVDNSSELLFISNNVSGVTQSNRVIDINANDIASLTVLKGPAAAALYGIRAGNGAIIITSKRAESSGEKEFRIGINTSLIASRLARRLQPTQRLYGPGAGGKLANPGDPSSIESWGPLLDTLRYSSKSSPWYREGTIVGQSDPTATGRKINLYDNVGNFFVTGFTNDNHISISKHTDKTGVYLSAGNLKQTGIVPNTDFYRNTVRLTIDNTFTDKLKIMASGNYIRSGSHNMATTGGAANGVIRGLVNTNPTFDNTNGYRDPVNTPEAYLLPDGSQRAYGGGIVGWNNPYWGLNNDPHYNEVNRVLAFIQTDYELYGGLSLTGRIGNDISNETRHEEFNIGDVANPSGVINEYSFSRRDINTDVYATLKRQLHTDFNVSLIAGANYFSYYRFRQLSLGSGLIIPGYDNIANASSVNTSQSTTGKELLAAYTLLQLDYKGWLFFSTSGRIEKTSTLARGKNIFLYPSADFSYLFTRAHHLENDILSFGKIRITAAQVGNDAPPYTLHTYYQPSSISAGISTISFPFTGLAGYAPGNILGNPNLRPEQIRTIEAGTELRFFKERLGLDVAIYHTVSRDQILPLSLPAATGYTAIIANAGQVSNRGAEILLTVVPVERKDFNWNMLLNLARNKSLVDKLAPGITNVVLTNFATMVGSSAITGQPYGVLYGAKLLTNNKGQVLIDDKKTLPNGQANSNYGYPFIDPNPGVVGDPNAAWSFGLKNMLTYKNFSFSFLWDVRYKFDLANNARAQMVLNGSAAETEARGTNHIFDGVKQSSGAVNDISVVLNEAWYKKTFNVSGMYVEHDLSWLRLRDVNLTFRVPRVWAENVRLSNAEITLTGRNILLFTNYTGSDPDVLTSGGAFNGFGQDFWGTPATRGYGISISLNF